MSNASLQQSQSLQQVLSPQMRQSLKLLQAPTTELQALIDQAMAVNPVLEIEANHESLDPGQEAPAGEDPYEWEDDERDLAIQERRGLADPAELQARRDFFFDSVVAPTTLGEHLRRQLESARLTPEEQRAGEVLIGSIDERGFLDTDLEVLAVESQVPLDLLRRAKKVLEGMDPAGVGATDLRDCLLIQLRALGQQGSVTYRLIEQNFEDLLARRFSKVARQLGLSEEEIEDQIKYVAELDPAPGSAFDGTFNPHIQADLVVERDLSGEWSLKLNDQLLPGLKISEEYKDLLARVGEDGEARGFLREHLRDARSLIRSLEQRQQTLLMIGREIAHRQEAVLTEGLAALKPMTMNEVAEVLEMHATTISRAVAGKYLRCPAGLFELRAFFTSGYERSDGSTVSNTGVKSRIKELIDKEDPRKPLSDEAIAKKLAAEDMPIARRTVAKYREQMKISPRHLRRVR